MFLTQNMMEEVRHIYERLRDECSNTKITNMLQFKPKSKNYTTGFISSFNFILQTNIGLLYSRPRNKFQNTSSLVKDFDGHHERTPVNTNITSQKNNALHFLHPSPAGCHQKTRVHARPPAPLP